MADGKAARMVFTIEGLELERVQAFQRDHECKDPDSPLLWGACHGWWGFAFYPVGFGMSVWVKCEVCGEKLNVTDDSQW
jgi:hypothetical protein